MALGRRHFLKIAAGTIATAAAPALGRAQSYPSRPVKIIVPFGPGGPPDVIARLMAQRLSQETGQQFVIENLPGGGGNTGTVAAARAPADGYTLLAISGEFSSIQVFMPARLMIRRRISRRSAWWPARPTSSW